MVSKSLLCSLTVLVLTAAAPGCAGSAASPPTDSEDASEPTTTDAGADDGCGLSFDEAVQTFAERVCQTTIYDRVTGYCTHWVPCSSL